LSELSGLFWLLFPKQTFGVCLSLQLGCSKRLIPDEDVCGFFAPKL